MDGDALVHTDLNPANLIVTSGGLRIVDWAYATKAAPWVELALLVQWLIGSGHTPGQAEDWLAPVPRVGRRRHRDPQPVRDEECGKVVRQGAGQLRVVDSRPRYVDAPDVCLG
jgi:aminoglycoside phosphotransferase (APT) family kinase protein